MGKLKILEVNLDLTAEEKKKKITQDHILNLKKDIKDYSPTFEPGKSVITVKKKWYQLWKRDKKMVIITEGNQKCWSLDSYQDKARNEKGEILKDEQGNPKMQTITYFSNVFGTLKESQQFISKVEKKAIADRKTPIDKLSWQIIGLVATISLLSVVAVMQFIILKGLKLV